MTSQISVKNVGKVFKKGLTVLEDLSFDVAREEFLCLLGPSGCGKTTLLRIMAGLETPTSGAVSCREPENGRLANSLLFQGLALFPWRTARENIALGLEFQGKGPAAAKAVMEQIKLTKLEGFEDYYPHQLSGGMKQRVALGRALVSDPELLLMDEPLGALDAALRRLMQEELLDLLRGRKQTVVFVTHSIEEALLLGDRVLVFSSRPAKIKADIKVPFRGPRNHSLARSAEFLDLAAGIWRLMEADLRQPPPSLPD